MKTGTYTQMTQRSSAHSSTTPQHGRIILDSAVTSGSSDMVQMSTMFSAQRLANLSTQEAVMRERLQTQLTDNY